MREWVAYCLYDADVGYFARTARIHALPQPLPWHALRRRDDYDRAVADMYRAQPGEAWHTPAEVLRVHAVPPARPARPARPHGRPNASCTGRLT